MASMLEDLSQELSDDRIRELSQQIGADEQQTRTALGAALPAFVEMLSRKAENPQDAAGLHQALAGAHGIGDLSSLESQLGVGGKGAPMKTPQKPAAPSLGGAGDLLGGLFGDKQARVEKGVSKMSGLDSAAVGKLLKLLAPVVIGMVAKKATSKKLDPGGLSGYLRKERDNMSQASPGGSNLIGRLLDQDGDGDFDLSDTLQLGMQMLFGGKNR